MINKMITKFCDLQTRSEKLNGELNVKSTQSVTDKNTAYAGKKNKEKKMKETYV